jgi:hypothetical protein
MPVKEDSEITKMYYTMGEVTAMFDVNPSLLRYYEKEFPILTPKKNKKGNRLFTGEDIEHLKIIFHLIRDKAIQPRLRIRSVLSTRWRISKSFCLK